MCHLTLLRWLGQSQKNQVVPLNGLESPTTNLGASGAGEDLKWRAKGGREEDFGGVAVPGVLARRGNFEGGVTGGLVVTGLESMATTSSSREVERQ